MHKFSKSLLTLNNEVYLDVVKKDEEEESW